MAKTEQCDKTNSRCDNYKLNGFLLTSDFNLIRLTILSGAILKKDIKSYIVRLLITKGYII